MACRGDGVGQERSLHLAASLAAKSQPGKWPSPCQSVVSDGHPSNNQSLTRPKAGTKSMTDVLSIYLSVCSSMCVCIYIYMYVYVYIPNI